MGSRLYHRFNILPGVSWCGSLMAISAGLAGGCDHKPAPSKDQFVELVKVTGQCSEDHAKESDTYVGEIYHHYNPETGRHMRYGFVYNVADGDERKWHSIKDPAWYARPFSVAFMDLSADDIAGASLTLHGISDRLDRGDNNVIGGNGYHSTCRLNVTERSDQPPKPPKASR